MTEHIDVDVVRGSKDLWAMPSPEFEAKFDAALDRLTTQLQERMERLEKALQQLERISYDALNKPGPRTLWAHVVNNITRNALQEQDQPELSQQERKDWMWRRLAP